MGTRRRESEGFKKARKKIREKEVIPYVTLSCNQKKENVCVCVRLCPQLRDFDHIGQLLLMEKCLRCACVSAALHSDSLLSSQPCGLNQSTNLTSCSVMVNVFRARMLVISEGGGGSKHLAL